MALDNNHVTKLGELKQLIDGLWGKVTTAISGLLSKNEAADTYATKDGSNATGTWGISISGTAYRATRLRNGGSTAIYGVHLGTTVAETSVNTSMLNGSFSLIPDIGGGILNIGENKLQTGRFNIFHRGTRRESRLYLFNAYAADRLALGYVEKSDGKTTDWYLVFGNKSSVNVARNYSRVAVTFEDPYGGSADYDLSVISSKLTYDSLTQGVFLPFLTPARHQNTSGTNSSVGDSSHPVHIDPNGEVVPCDGTLCVLKQVSSYPTTFEANTLYVL